MVAELATNEASTCGDLPLNFTLRVEGITK
jgi:hypothetical protein